MSEANKELVRRFFEDAYTGGNPELVDEIMSPGYLAHGPGAEVLTLESDGARAQGLEAVKNSIENNPSDIEVLIDQQVAEGDTVVSRITMSAGGNSWVAVAFQRIENSKIVETWRIANNRRA